MKLWCVMECKGFRWAFSWHCPTLPPSRSPTQNQPQSTKTIISLFTLVIFEKLGQKRALEVIWLKLLRASSKLDQIAQGIVQVDFGFGRVEIPLPFWGQVAVFVTLLLNMLFLCAQLEFPSLWLVTVASWASTACLWVCLQLLYIPSDSGRLLRSTLSLHFLFWLNKASSLSFSSQVTCLQPQQPSSTLYPIH